METTKSEQLHNIEFKLTLCQVLLVVFLGVESFWVFVHLSSAE